MVSTKSGSGLHDRLLDENRRGILTSQESTHSNGSRGSFTNRESTRRDSRTCQESSRRVSCLTAIFIILHILFFVVQVCLLLWLIWGSPSWFYIMLASMFVSVSVYTHFSYYCKAEHFSKNVCTFRPLVDVDSKWKFLCWWLVLAFFPGVVLVLALESYYARRDEQRRPDHLDGMRWLIDPKHTLTCKALVSVFEGGMTALVALGAYGSSHRHLSQEEDAGLGVVAFLGLFVAGTALVESDICLADAVNSQIRNAVKKPFRRRVTHVGFRSCEVLARICILALLFEAGALWVLVEFLFAFLFVCFAGGRETHLLWCVLCGLPCVCTDLFFFLTMPAKREAARGVSTAFLVRHLAECALVFWLFWQGSIFSELLLCAAPILSFLYLCLWLWWDCTMRGLVLSIHGDIFRHAREGNTPGVMDCLDISKLNVNQPNHEGDTPLMLAAWSDDSCQKLDICARLIEKRASLDISTIPHATHGRTVLHKVVASDDTDLLEILLDAAILKEERGNAMLLKDEKGRTPLHEAVGKGHARAAELLVNKIPELIDTADNDNNRPCDYAISDKMREILRRYPCAPPQPLVTRDCTPQNQEAGALSEGLCSTLLRVSGGIHTSLCPRPSVGPSVSTTFGGGQNVLERQAPPLRKLRPVAADDGTYHPDKDVRELRLVNAVRHGGRYFALIGSGAFSKVIRVQDEDTKTHWALKITCHHPQHREHKELAKREVDIYKKIRDCGHPNCMQSHNDYQEGDADFSARVILLEYAPNGTLFDVLESSALQANQNDRVFRAPEDCRRWAGEIFLGLRHLHLKIGIMMRDLKPNNIVLDDKNRCKIIDHGVSKEGRRSNDQSVHPCPGTPWFMAPEILGKLEYSWPCDIFSLGITTWLMFSGGATSNQLLHFAVEPKNRSMELQKAFEDPWAKVPDDVMEFVRNTTLEDPKKRWQHETIKRSEFMKKCLQE